jgi:hypothetical protein
MDRLERLLRDQYHEGWVRLDAGDVMRGVTRRRRRRVAVSVAATAVLTLGAASVGVAVFAGGTAPREQATAPPAVEASVEASVEGTPTASPDLSVSAFPHFANADLGYVLQFRCDHTLPAATRCGYRLAVTTDAARTWTFRAVPVPRFAEDSVPFDAAGLRVISRDLLIVDTAHLARKVRLISRDAGRTWHETVMFPTRTVKQITPGSVVFGAPSDPSLTGVRLQVIAPDGSAAWFDPRLPSGQRPQRRDVVEATDGSLWLSTTDGTRGMLLVSRDRGRTWTPVPLPVTAPDVELATVDGRRLLLTSAGPQRALFRSGDAGASWQPVAVASGHALAGVALPDGGFILSTGDTGRLFRLPPGGGAPVVLGARALSGGIARAGAWFSGSDNGGTTTYISPGGATWRLLWLP